MTDLNIGAFLFEIGAEELPAKQIPAISNHIKEGLAKALSDAAINSSSIESYCTPRRLFFYIDGLALNAVDKESEIKGPPETIAKAADGSLAQAAIGFAKKNNLNEKDLYFKDGYLYAKQKIHGQTPRAVLEAKIPEIISSTPGTRFMRWANGDLKFARPLQWIVALMISSKGKELLNINIEGLKAGSISYGHRFLGPEPFEIQSKEQYIEQLEKQGCYLDPAKRRKKIVEEAEKLAKTVEGKIVIDDDLLDEVVQITENPSPILCSFDRKFLEIPACVLKTVMIHHQRYLPIECNYVADDVNGVSEHRLLPYFIAVSNNPRPEARANIKSGNEKVIVPRFKDAEFFVTEDTKIKLEDRLPKLEKLNSTKGNMLQKSKRLVKIVNYLLNEIKETYPRNPHKGPHNLLNDKIADSILRATLLSKTDLTTNLVFEFTELQGEIGAVYAERERLDPTIVETIAEHYQPRFAGDKEPSSIGAKLLAVADKMDTIVCAFALGNIPSGSVDPFALRRQANGLLGIILHAHLIINVDALVDYVVNLQKQEFGDGDIVTKIRGRGEDRKEVKVAELNWEGCNTKVKEFLESRLPFVLEIYHKDTVVNKAAFTRANPLVELNKAHMMIHLILSTKERPDDHSKLVEAVTRIANIASKSSNTSRDKINPALFESDYEKNFLQAIDPLSVLHNQNLEYQPILSGAAILKIVKPINDFFDNVLVNSEDEKIKANRQALVAYAHSILSEMGDFSVL